MQCSPICSGLAFFSCQMHITRQYFSLSSLRLGCHFDISMKEKRNYSCRIPPSLTPCNRNFQRGEGRRREKKLRASDPKFTWENPLIAKLHLQENGFVAARNQNSFLSRGRQSNATLPGFVFSYISLRFLYKANMHVALPERSGWMQPQGEALLASHRESCEPTPIAFHPSLCPTTHKPAVVR